MITMNANPLIFHKEITFTSREFCCHVSWPNGPYVEKSSPVKVLGSASESQGYLVGVRRSNTRGLETHLLNLSGVSTQNVTPLSGHSELAAATSGSYCKDTTGHEVKLKSLKLLSHVKPSARQHHAPSSPYHLITHHHPKVFVGACSLAACPSPTHSRLHPRWDCAW